MLLYYANGEIMSWVVPSKWYIWIGLLTKREVKMAGYWTSSFFACLWTETESRSINSQKKRGQYSAILTEKAWSIKDLLFGFKGNFFSRDSASSPERSR